MSCDNSIVYDHTGYFDQNALKTKYEQFNPRTKPSIQTDNLQICRDLI
jgi:hypothetical protein